MPLLVALSACLAPEPPPAPQPVAAPAAPPPVAPPVTPLPDGPFRRELSPGLVLAAHDLPEIPDIGYSRPDPVAVAGVDRRLFVVTIDPALHELALLSVLEPAIGGPTRTAPEWAEAYDLEVTFNPGMYEPDGRGTGHTRAGAY